MALRFISGKYQGGEYPLTEGQEIVIGRSSELDMVLVEEMVSRKHARILLLGGVITIEDLGSTNGTFINGEKIQRSQLKESDRILIGTSILKVVATAVDSPEAAAAARDNARQNMSRAGDDAPRMSGSLEEIPLPDLLQLFGTSRKDGVLLLRNEAGSGRIYLKEGLIRHAELDGKATINARKAVYRMLGWVRGVFELEPPDPREVPTPLDASAQELLMEGFRRQDEFMELAQRLPALGTRLKMASPLRGSLRSLTPEELDLLDLAVNSPNLQSVLDTTPEPDLETAQRIEGRWKRGDLGSG
jgi:pSer/pThr/pTyr-binding forkhead associated (FHA) protein